MESDKVTDGKELDKHNCLNRQKGMARSKIAATKVKWRALWGKQGMRNMEKGSGGKDGVRKHDKLHLFKHGDRRHTSTTMSPCSALSKVDGGASNLCSDANLIWWCMSLTSISEWRPVMASPTCRKLHWHAMLYKCYDLSLFLLIYFLFCLSRCAAPCLALFAFLCACFIAYLCVVLSHILHDT